MVPAVLRLVNMFDSKYLIGWVRDRRLGDLIHAVIFGRSGIGVRGYKIMLDSISSSYAACADPCFVVGSMVLPLKTAELWQLFVVSFPYGRVQGSSRNEVYFSSAICCGMKHCFPSPGVKRPAVTSWWWQLESLLETPEPHCWRYRHVAHAAVNFTVTSDNRGACGRSTDRPVQPVCISIYIRVSGPVCDQSPFDRSGTVVVVTASFRINLIELLIMACFCVVGYCIVGVRRHAERRRTSKSRYEEHRRRACYVTLVRFSFFYKH